MLKWIGGCLVVVVVLIAGGSYFAMRSMRNSLSADGSSRVAIHAPVARVFASLSHGDSAATFMAPGNRVTPSRHGPLQLGDTVRVEMRTTLGMKPEPMIWVVKEMIPDQRIVFDLHTSGAKAFSATRADSLVAQGDSTIVFTRFISSALDTAKSATTAAMMMSMFQMQGKLEIESLKHRIEGFPGPRNRK